MILLAPLVVRSGSGSQMFGVTFAYPFEGRAGTIGLGQEERGSRAELLEHTGDMIRVQIDESGESRLFVLADWRQRWASRMRRSSVRACRMTYA